MVSNSLPRPTFRFYLLDKEKRDPSAESYCLAKISAFLYRSDDTVEEECVVPLYHQRVESLKTRGPAKLRHLESQLPHRQVRPTRGVIIRVNTLGRILM